MGDELKQVGAIFRRWSGALALAGLACGTTAKHDPPRASAGSGGSAQAGKGGAPSTEPDSGEAGQPSTGAGSGVGGTSGTSGQSGSSGGATVAGRGGRASSGAGSGAGGSAAQGGHTAVVIIPGQSERETEIIDVLQTPRVTLDATTGEELVAYGTAISEARAYLVCRCALSPGAPPEDVDALLRSCAEAEAGVSFLRTKDAQRCIRERLDDVPGFEDYLRCRTELAQTEALYRAGVCRDPSAMPPTVEVKPCVAPAGGEALANECALTLYCADDSRVLGYRCDSAITCADRSDETDCFDALGRDLILCRNQAYQPAVFCTNLEGCGNESNPPMCDANRPERFICADGSDVSLDVVCDRENDCPDDSDETHCLRGAR